MSDRLYTGQERRRAARFAFNTPITLVHDGGSIEARGTDFNEDSVRVVHDEAIPVGTMVTVKAVDELGNQVEITGEVTRVDPEDEEGQIAMVITREPERGEPDE